MLYDFALGMCAGMGLMFLLAWCRVEDEIRRRKAAEAQVRRYQRQMGRERNERFMAFFEGEA